MEVKKTYYDNGNIKQEEQVNQEGKTHGTLKQYHENGQFKNKVNFKDGKREGLWDYYHHNGEFSKKENFKDGYEIFE